ncbi:PTS sugar transporter subunit IIC [Calorimonas adulescens]|uniref:Permease IIC component n=2 Tax=Calorimonas adulescens TaxID=2606906 RepID=A0A5D8QE95_9THEO|nr:PTS sugar transporter subunit IIC [Calorimonas adulescens]
MDKLESRLMPIAEYVSKNKYLISIRDGFLISMPLLVVGSIFMLISNFPVQPWIDLLKNTTLAGTSIASYFSNVTNATFSIMAIFVVIGIGYNYAKQENTNMIFGAAIAVLSWFMLMPFTTMYTPEGASKAVQVTSIPLDWVGSKGIFIGILCAFLSVKIYKWVEDKGWTIKMPNGVPPTVGQSFAALFPIGAVVVVFFFIRVLFTLTPWGNAFDFIYKILQMPLQKVGDSLGAMMGIYLFAHILWFFGIHGTNITDSVFRPILYALSAENLAALQAGKPLPHIINTQFQDLFATYGGAGSTLSLLIAMFFFCRSKRIKELGRIAIIPGIFGINEPIIFGLPIVLNPTIAIPFIIVPMINILVSYITMAIGMVPVCNGVIMPWTTPPIISGFLSSGWQGALLQVFLIALGVVIYYPFIKTIDKQYIRDEAEVENNPKDDDISLDDLTF